MSFPPPGPAPDQQGHQHPGQPAGAYPAGGYQQPYPTQPQQPASPYQTPPAAHAGYSPYGQSTTYASPEAQQASQTALVLGIIGLFVFGIILGPLAIMKANEAQRGGVDATAGKVVGWIALILHALGLIVGILMFLSMASFFAAFS